MELIERERAAFIPFYIAYLTYLHCSFLRCYNISIQRPLEWIQEV